MDLIQESNATLASQIFAFSRFCILLMIIPLIGCWCKAQGRKGGKGVPCAVDTDQSAAPSAATPACSFASESPQWPKHTLGLTRGNCCLQAPKLWIAA
ncbi:hypothetical protein IE53DRAFT_384178, partial [Violaceomyces palustris]